MRGRLAWLVGRSETQTYRAATGTLDVPSWGVAEHILAELTDRVGALIAVQVQIGGGDMQIPNPIPRPGYTIEDDLLPAASMDDIKNFFGIIKETGQGK